MSKFAFYLKRIILIMPIASILGASLLPLQTWCQQALILFALIWFNVFILFDVLGK
jgi:hypothetical protein